MSHPKVSYFHFASAWLAPASTCTWATHASEPATCHHQQLMSSNPQRPTAASEHAWWQPFPAGDRWHVPGESGQSLGLIERWNPHSLNQVTKSRPPISQVLWFSMSHWAPDIQPPLVAYKTDSPMLVGANSAWDHTAASFLFVELFSWSCSRSKRYFKVTLHTVHTYIAFHVQFAQ